MSFLASAFSGASNNFQPSGSQAAVQQSQKSNEVLNSAQGTLQGLMSQLYQQTQGGGPNLANQQLQNATQQNVGQQAALMAGQRGASSNPALLARQVAMQGGQLQQQAAGQSAQNVLAQQLAAQQQLGAVAGTSGSLANQNYGIAQGTIQSNNQIGAQQAQQNATMNQGILGGIAGVGGQILSNVGGAAFSGLGAQKKAQGGMIQHYAEGTPQQPVQPMQQQPLIQVPQWATNFMTGRQAQPIVQPNVQALQSVSDSFKRSHFAQGGMALPFQPMDLRHGGPIQARGPQEKAQVTGNSLKNDKIPAMVSEGEIVIPRDIAMSPNAPKLAAQFVANISRKK